MDVLVIDEMLADDAAFAGQIIQHAGWHAGFLEHLHQQRAADRRLLGRFHNDGIASDERRRNHPGQNRHRKIPGRDDERDAARPVVLVAFFAGHVLGQSRQAADPHLLRVEEKKIDRFANIAVGFRPRFADFEHFQSG